MTGSVFIDDTWQYHKFICIMAGNVEDADDLLKSVIFHPYLHCLS